jgi:hypothetical protein
MPRLVLVAGLLLLAVYGLIEVNAWRIRDAADAAACTSLYHAARSAADTARIDAGLAPRERGQGGFQGNLRCGELRRRNRTR